MSKLLKKTRPTSYVESAPNATKPHVAKKKNLDAIAFMISISALRTFNFSWQLEKIPKSGLNGCSLSN